MKVEDGTIYSYLRCAIVSICILFLTRINHVQALERRSEYYVEFIIWPLILLTNMLLLGLFFLQSTEEERSERVSPLFALSCFPSYILDVLRRDGYAGHRCSPAGVANTDAKNDKRETTDG